MRSLQPKGKPNPELPRPGVVEHCSLAHIILSEDWRTRWPPWANEYRSIK
jgi:hypothetical protein